MTNNELRKLPPLERFLFWIKERWQVLVRRRAGKLRPWSTNEILQTTYFTNVRREDDKTTVWLRENLREPLRDKPEVLFATIAFRWFNWIPTGELLKTCGITTNNELGLFVAWDCPTVVRILTQERIAGNQVFTGAFNISNSGHRKRKIDLVCEDYITPVWEDRGRLQSFFGKGQTLDRAHRFLSQYPAMGGSGFMAGQVVADLKYTSWLSTATDWWTWCCLGPGSKRGLNRVLSREPEGPVPQNWHEEIAGLQETVEKRLPLVGRLHAQDLQNCLCEYFKFCRALEGGHIKRNYKGAN